MSPFARSVDQMDTLSSRNPGIKYRCLLVVGIVIREKIPKGGPALALNGINPFVWLGKALLFRICNLVWNALIPLPVRSNAVEKKRGLTIRVEDATWSPSQKRKCW